MASENDLHASSVSQEGEVNQVNVSTPCVFTINISTESYSTTCMFPSKVLPFFLANLRKTTLCNRKKSKTSILTDTLEEEKLTAK